MAFVITIPVKADISQRCHSGTVCNPGRLWAAKLQPHPKTSEQLIERVEKFLSEKPDK
jgi:hypothetical protein